MSETGNKPWTSNDQEGASNLTPLRLQELEEGEEIKRSIEEEYRLPINRIRLNLNKISDEITPGLRSNFGRRLLENENTMSKVQREREKKMPKEFLE